jgi:hypothetical protein
VQNAPVNDGDVCKFSDSPRIQEDLLGDRDECGTVHDPQARFREFDCNTQFDGMSSTGMLVDHAAQLVQPGRDGCTLYATPLMSDASAPTP